ncbi:serine protease [Corallococcus aberystwythensis]|uniref:Serine protease n=1 Tax=Corallococcus aberystwythensis TaxID=2316722 RepID=A0A3A8PTH3_9BACT|nr:serine protease [Corallococcus aberystwythensis]
MVSLWLSVGPSCRKQEAPASSPGSMEAGLLERVKDATVLIRSEESSGSGFVVSTGQGRHRVVTNHHVVELKDGRLSTSLQVTYRSGTGREVTRQARVIAKDRGNDLALLEVADTAGLEVEPLDEGVAARETLGLYAVGFPFGEMLSFDEQLPAATLTRGSVSSLRRSRLGALETIQVDSAFNPGNSGGPVVDVEGRLLGVAVATVRGTNISFVIPWERVEALLESRAAEVQVGALPEGCEDACDVPMTLEVSNPDGVVKELELRVIHADEAFLSFARTPPYAPEGESHKRVSHQGAGRVKLAATVTFRSGSETYVQVGYVTEKGSRTYDLPLRLGTLREPSARTARAAPVAKEQALPPEAAFEKLDLERPLVDAQVADGGRLVVLRMEGLASVSILDVKARRIVHTLELPEPQFLFAAGGTSLLVYLPTLKLFHRYSLTTFEREKIGRFMLGGPVLHLVMGNANAERALVIRDVPDTRGNDPLTLLDVQKLEPVTAPRAVGTAPPQWALEKQRPVDSSKAFSYAWRANPQGTVFTAMRPGVSPEGIYVGRVVENRLEFQYRHESGGLLLVGGDGAIYGRGRTFAQDLTPLTQLPNTQLLPAVGAMLYLGLPTSTASSKGGVRPALYVVGKDAPLAARLPIDFEWTEQPASASTGLFVDRRMMLLPAMGAVVVVPPDRKQVRLFDFPALLRSEAPEYLYVRSVPPLETAVGTRYAYQLEVRSTAGGVKLALEAGPEGMSVSPEGIVGWSVPRNARAAERVVIRATDRLGSSVLHAFPLTVRGGTP